MDIRQYQRQFDILHARLEKRVAPLFYKALAASVAPVLTSLDPNSILQAPWIEAYKKAYSMYAVFAKQEYQQLKKNNPTKDDPISFFNENWRLLMEKYGNDIAWDFATDLNETTIEQIRRAIAAGSASASNREIAALIREYTLGTVGKQRSLLIARTETTTGANKAKEIGAKSYFDEIGETQGYKMWISRADTHVRHDHMIINDIAVPFDSEFKVGGFPANVPGDPKLPAKERVRCRCTFVALSASGYRRRFGK